MKLLSSLFFIALLGFFAQTNAANECGFENDLGMCVHFRKCPKERIKNLAFVAEENAYKQAKHCERATSVCCSPPMANSISSTSVEAPVQQDKCTGECLNECPFGWNEDVLPSPAPNYGAYLLNEKASDDEKLCSQRGTKCCLKPVVNINNRPDECGQRNEAGFFDRISGGGAANFAEFPWLVVIATKYTLNETVTATVYKSSGSLIAPTIVLTAAHTVSDVSLTNLTIRAGDYNVANSEEPLPHQDIGVKEIIIHEDFHRPTHVNNIALLVLEKPIVQNKNVGLLCLSQPSAVNFGSKCLIAGWGRNGSDRNPTAAFQNVLRKASVDLVDHDSCQQRMRFTKLGNDFLLHDSFVCAIGENGEDTCKGDGGTPLICPLKSDNSRYYQLGITSWGIGCSRNDLPGVYVDVTKYHDWIKEKIRSLGADTGGQIEEKQLQD